MSDQPAIRKCRICGSRRTVYLCDTHNEHSKTTWISNYRCTHCGSVFVGNDITSQELGEAYSTLDSELYYDEIKGENIKKMETAIADLRRVVSTDDRVIDIGTGDGWFVELLAKAGFQNVSAHEIKGADLSRIQGIAKEIYEDHDYTTVPDGRFKAVTLLDVVEHVIDPDYLLQTCNRILETNGIVYFHTPVVTPLDRMMHLLQKLPLVKKIGKVWQRGRTSIFHLENYTPRSLTHVLEKAGFSNIAIEVKNELSWPVSRYVRVYVCEKQGLPTFLAPLLTPFLYPFLATNLFNANKAIVTAMKARDCQVHPPRFGEPAKPEPAEERFSA